MKETSASEVFVSMLALMLVFSWAHLSPREKPVRMRYYLVLTLCEPFSLFHEIIDNLFLCDNVLHKLEILYSSLIRMGFERNPAKSRAQIWRHNVFRQPVASAAVRSLAVILSLLNSHNFITRWYSLIKFRIRIHVNIVQKLACVTVMFGGQGFAEHQSGG